MRTNEQGEKVACSKCRVGHRTSKCVDNQDHQNDVRVIRSSGRPSGSRTDPGRAAKQREKKRKPRAKRELEEQGVADLQREAHTFCLQCAAADPVQARFSAGYQQFPVSGYQNPGSFVNPPALVPSPAQRSSSLPDPFYAGLPAHVRRPLEQPAYTGMGFGPVPPLPAVPAPISASSAPVSQPVVANQPAALAQNGWVNNQFMGFPQVDITAQVQQGGSMMIQSRPGDLMGAENIAPSVPFMPPVPSVLSPNLFSFNEESWELFLRTRGSPEQPVQPAPAANSDAQSSGSPSSSESFSYHDLLKSDGYFSGGLPALGTRADQGASASSGQDPFGDVNLPFADPSTSGDLYDPGEESGCPVETTIDFSLFSYGFT
ncbi:hypothetical protein FPCIR_4756 [Fusarium pseudocircinatum]|uniref:Copper-fist domain-containing protein n=1 Tax=Fusarium pseudocircinatum TaxID=56676 RepID=A0A8H5PDX9_9HYPO|nr:hypothetical protein FPCIR_4756 [Fusarium pseudocircinatum]